MEQFPPNSEKSRDADRGPKRVERVTSDGAVRRRRQPLGRKFHQTFFNGDSKMAFEYMIANSVVPAVKEMMLEAVNSGFERLAIRRSSSWATFSDGWATWLCRVQQNAATRSRTKTTITISTASSQQDETCIR